MTAKSERLAAGVGLLLALLSLSPLARAQEKKHLTISTDEGFVSLSTDKPSAEKLGLHVYPGAKVRAEEGNDSGANLSLTSKEGAVRLQVMKFATSDPAAKVLAFYKKDMTKWGNVLECKGGKQVSFDVTDPAHKNSLTCDKDGHDDGNATLLKTGTDGNQRIVAVVEKGKETEFTIIHIENSHGEHETL
jgi:hypothetical protein